MSNALRSFKKPDSESEQSDQNVQSHLRAHVSLGTDFPLEDVLFAHQTDSQNVNEGNLRSFIACVYLME